MQMHLFTKHYLILVVGLSFLCVSTLMVQRHNYVLAETDVNKDPNTNAGGQKRVTPYGFDTYYACVGSVLTEVNTDPAKPTKSVEDCAASGRTCYQLDNQVKQEHVAACLYNPPVGASGAGCPTVAEIEANKKTSPQTCRYFNPSISLFDTAITQGAIDNYIAKYSPIFVRGGIGDLNEFQRRVNYIVSKSKEAGLNPALFLGYWRTESAFSTIRVASELGCAPGQPSMQGFENQVQCAIGLISGGSSTALCARSKDPNSDACRFENGRLKDPKNAAIFKSDPSVNYRTPTVPIGTFDDFAEMYGPRSPLLGDAAVNNNCVHTYNELVETAVELGACKAAPNTNGSLASCKFSRGTDSAVYQSQKLLSYFQQVSQDTGVPAAILGAIVKVESSTGAYSISEYSDDDITIMENTNQIAHDIDKKIVGTNKALCPRSETGALGIMQLQPQAPILDEIANANPTPPYKPNYGAHCDNCVKNGLKFANKAGFTSKNYSQLTIEDYCNPKLSLYMGAGFILEKLHQQNIGDGQHWDASWTTDENILRTAARTYYGNDAQTKLYEDSLVKSVSECRPTSSTYSFPVQGQFIPFPRANSPAEGYASIQNGQYSYVCGHSRPIFRAIDIGVSPAGGTPVVAVIGGDAYAGEGGGDGPFVKIKGDDGLNYLYLHLQSANRKSGRVNAGDVIGYIAAANDPNSKNNGIAHVHFSVSTDNVADTLADPADIDAGPLLDKWGRQNVCLGSNKNIIF